MRSTRPSLDRIESMTSSVDWHNWALVAILLLGMALRAYQLATDSLWIDEITTAVYAQEPDIPSVLARLSGRSGRPLHFILVYLISSIGNDEFWLRLPSVAFGILGLVTTYKLGQLLFGRMEGLLAAFLLAISPFHLRYSQEARSYALFMWLSLLTLYFLLHAWRSGRWRWWIGFAAASVLNTYTHYFAIFVLTAELVAAAILLVVDSFRAWRAVRSIREDVWERQKRFLVPMAASLLLTVLAFLPSQPHLQAFLRRQSGAAGLARGVDPTLSFFVDVLSSFATGQQGRTMNASVWPFLGFALFGVVACLGRRQLRSLLWIAVWLGLPFAILFAVPAKHFFALHYVIFVLPLFLLLVARGVTGAAAWIGRWAAARMAADGRLFPLLCMVALLIFGLLESLPLKTYYGLEKEDWRAAIAYLESHVQPGDLIICDGVHRGGQDSYRPCRALQHYFGSAFEENLVTRETAVAQTIESISQEKRGVWGLVFADLRRWSPGVQGITVAAFNLTGVVGSEDDAMTILDRSISILESFPEFMTKEGRFDVHLELVKLYTMQGDMDRAQEQLQLAQAVMPADALAAEAWASVNAWLQERESRP